MDAKEMAEIFAALDGVLALTEVRIRKKDRAMMLNIQIGFNTLWGPEMWLGTL